MFKSRIFSLIPLVLLSVSCLEQYNPRPFWEKIEKERQLSLNPETITATDGRKLSLGEDGRLIIASSDEPDYDPTTESAEEIYGKTCAVCHGKNGQGVPHNPARVFHDSQWQSDATDEEIAWIIRHGTMALQNSPEDPEATQLLKQMKSHKSFRPLTGTMPASGGRISAPLTDTQIEDLIKIIRSFSP
ncbi:MAG: cytochrome c [Deltaproteobacteria bacterium]|nr:cytochrome c [Deltaproteobacteria bacterium]